jgi:hypothetical protein
MVNDKDNTLDWFTQNESCQLKWCDCDSFWMMELFLGTEIYDRTGHVTLNVHVEVSCIMCTDESHRMD